MGLVHAEEDGADDAMAAQEIERSADDTEDEEEKDDIPQTGRRMSVICCILFDLIISAAVCRNVHIEIPSVISQTRCGFGAEELALQADGKRRRAHGGA